MKRNLGLFAAVAATFLAAATWAEYVVDGPSYEQNGTRVTEHHVCKKV
jgi:hypothetical protein